MKTFNIMLVEDNSDDEELTLRALRRAGFTNITVARDGAEALDILLGDGRSGGGNNSLPDLLLLDLRLPKLDGIDVLRRLRYDERTKGIKVIALSSYEDPYDRMNCRELGVLDFWPKPPDGERFASLFR